MSGWYSLNTTLSHNCVLNFVLSSRGEGKTTEAIRQCVRGWRNKGERFVIIRRTVEECRDVRRVLFDDLVELGEVKSGEFFVYGKYIFEMAKSKNDKPQLCGYLLSLSVDSGRKSRKFMNVRHIIYDEFIPENGRYINDEVRLFVSLITTILRYNKRTVVICMANSLSEYSPYFSAFNLTNKVNEEFIKGDNVLIHNYKSSEMKETKMQMGWYKLLSGTAYGNYVINNTPILDDEAFIRLLKEPGKEAMFSVITGRNFSFTVWYSTKEGIYWACKGLAKTCPAYNITSTIKDAINTRVQKIVRVLEKKVERNALFFASMETKKEIEGILNLNRGRD